MTLYTLASDGWSAEVSSNGAELQSLKRLSENEEYIWQGNPAIWAGRAPILFPIVGRLRDNRILANGRSWPLPKHGLARHSEFALLDQATASLKLQLVSSESSRVLYPYEFSLEISFNLSPGLLAITYKVRNCDCDDMYFSIGSHPAFRLPMKDRILEDYFVEFDEEETLKRYILHNGLLPESGVAFLHKERKIYLTPDLFNQDALIFKHIRSHKISLIDKQSGTRLSVLTGGAPHLGIWSKPAAPFICIEPWFGYDDPVNATGKIEEKPGIVKLPAGQQFQTGIGIKIH